MLGLVDRLAPVRRAIVARWAHLALDRPGLRPPQGAPWLWAHAASGGDVFALRPTLERARARLGPDAWVGVTVVTQTGWEAAQRGLRAGWIDGVGAAPIGQPAQARALCARGSLRAAIVERLEWWPSLLDALSATRTPWLLHNARLSPRSARGLGAGMPRAWRRWSWSMLRACAAASEGDAGRVRWVSGVGVEGVRVVPTSKWITATPPDRDAVRALRVRLGWQRLQRRDVLVAGSLHEGEWGPALWRGVCGRRLLVAPRYPDRDSDAVVASATRAGLRAVRLSQLSTPHNPDVVVLDRFGLLAAAYALGQWALIGGTFGPLGGHNPLEAWAAGAGVIVGPRTHAIAPLLHDADRLPGALTRVASADASPWPPRAASVAPAQGLAAWLTAHQRAANAGIDWALDRLLASPERAREARR